MNINKKRYLKVFLMVLGSKKFGSQGLAFSVGRVFCLGQSQSREIEVCVTEIWMTTLQKIH
jgi:hypothetical protein